MKRTLWLLFAAILSAPDAGVTPEAPKAFAPLRVARQASAQKVRLGEPFWYEVKLVHRPEQRFELRLPANLGPFELLDHSRQRVDAAQDSATTFRIKLALFELGKKPIPDFAFDGTTPEGTGRQVVPGLEVEAIASLSKEEEQKGAALYDIKPPVEVMVRSYRLLWIGLYLLGLAAVGYALYRWSRRAARPSAVLARPIEPLHVRTLAALDALRSEDLPGRGLFRDFHFRLSEILRAYVGERYQFDALECTSAELLEKLGQLRTPGLPVDELAGFVHRADLVKFAKAPAHPLDCKEALEFGYRLVQQTSAPLSDVLGQGPVATNDLTHAGDGVS